MGEGGGRESDRKWEIVNRVRGMNLSQWMAEPPSTGNRVAKKPYLVT